MAKQEQEQEDDFSVDAMEYPSRDDDRSGPPDDWVLPSWYSFKTGEWFWERKPDPCPVRPLGFRDGEYIFITAAGERRSFTSGQLHNRGGLPDLFVGELWWPLRHFRKYDLEKKALVGGLQRERCIALLLRLCRKKGLYDGTRPHRSVGTWRGPDGAPVVHAGDRIFNDGFIEDPGVEIGDATYVIGSSRQAPSYANLPRGGYKWLPAGTDLGRIVAAHLDEWHWESAESRDLFQGGQYCNMLCAALTWLPHIFVRAPYGSGKSMLLRYARTLCGGAAHPVQQTYSKAYLEQNFSSTAAALFLDEAESTEASHRIRALFELIRLLSDDGAEGGRGTAGGKSRKLDVHGTVTMAATTSEDWQPQDRSRIAYLEIRPLKQRRDHSPAPPEVLAQHLQLAAEMSPAIRARAVALWPLFLTNLKAAREAVLGMGGVMRDADQLGHLIAGWWTMTQDEPLTPDHPVAQLERFRPHIVSLIEEEDGEDEPSKLLNTLFGLTPDKWVGGERVTIGQIIAHARDGESFDADKWRKTLLPYGLALVRHQGENWDQGWLAVANHHPGLDELLSKYPSYQGKKRRQILGDLQRTVAGVEHVAQPGATHMRIGGSQTRYLLIPPIFLPSRSDEPA